MHARSAFILPLLTLALALCAAAGPAPAGSPVLPAREVRAGMRGYGLTVFHGTKITRFPITVLGISRGYLAGSDMILVRVDGGYPVEHGTGIVAGMSGSPIYVDGRLVGALSYGWPFSMEPIGGVTPIESMLAELPGAARPLPAEAPWGSVGRLEAPVQAGGRTFRQVRVSPRPGRSQAGTLELAPIATLLQASGLGDRALGQLNRSLQALPLTAVQGGAGPKVRAAIPPIRPGSAVGVLLLSGDLEVAGTGTLTWRDGNTVLAFGHSMAELGEVSLPLSASYVHAVLPSYSFSYKMASQLGTVGELTRDRLWAVGGQIHAPAPMVPLRLAVRDPARGRSTLWNLKAAQHRYLTGPLAGAALTEGIGALAPSMAQTTARMRFRIEAAGLPPLEVTDTAVGPPVDVEAASRLSGLLGSLLDNPFEPVKLSSVQVDIDLLPGRRSAVLERLYTDRTRYHPGDTVRLGVVLKPYGEERQVREIELPLPPDAGKGSLKIGVSGGDSLADLRKALGLEEPEPADLDHLLQRLRHEERGQTLAVRMVLPGSGVAVGRRSFPLLTPGLREALKGSTHTEVDGDKEVLHRAQDTPWAVQGKAVVSVEVEEREGRRPEKAEAKKEEAAVADLPSGGRAWTLQGRPGWQEGRFRGTALDASGSLAPGPGLDAVYRSSDALAWSLARSPEGRLFVGLGGTGEVLRLAGPGQAERFARTGAAAVLSLLPSAEGLWAGTGPQGEALLLGPDGLPARRFALPVSYVWALAPAPGGGALAATGLPGRVYRLEPDGREHLVWESGQQHVRALATARDGTLLAATAGEGLVVRLDPATGGGRTVFQSPHPGVEALAWSGDTLWAASGPDVFLLGEGEPRRFPLGDAVLALAPDGEGGVWAGLAGGGLARVGAAGPQVLLPEADGRPVLALLADPEGLLAARGFSAEVLRLAPREGDGEYLSPVLDAGRPVRWGSLRWVAEAPGGGVQVHTRSGPVPEPDGSWSDWSWALIKSGGDAIPSPAARYLQVRVVLAGRARLQGLTVAFSPLPERPAVGWAEPRGGERWSGSRTVKWRLLAGEAARVSYDVEISRDGGATWSALARARPAGSGEESLSLATASYPDGPCVLRVSAWDRADPAGTRAEAVTAPFLLANSKPKIAWLDPRAPGEIRGLALTEAAAVVEVSWRRGQEAWLPAEPQDGLFDSTREEFRVVLGEGGAVEIRIKDEAGNERTETRSP